MATVAEHYERSDPLAAVRAVLDAGGDIDFDRLADHFHTGGKLATERMADLLDLTPDDVVLDAGAGLGGPARYLAERFGCRVLGIDLTPDYVEAGRRLTDLRGLTDRVELRVGDITATGLDDASVDLVWTQHVAMNIADRDGLYRELRRVLKPGGRLALFDVVDGGGGPVLLPVPWATEPEHSHLVTRDRLRVLLEGSGFHIDVWDDPTAAMAGVMRAAAPPRPGLGRYFENIDEGRTALVLAVCTAT